MRQCGYSIKFKGLFAVWVFMFLTIEDSLNSFKLLIFQTILAYCIGQMALGLIFQLDHFVLGTIKGLLFVAKVDS